MARIARVVVPGMPHHVTQRGVRRMEAFFDEEDYKICISLMGEWCWYSGAEVWAYCLMPSHIHLVAVPEREDSLASGVGEAHRRYTRHINFKKGCKGCLWCGRFSSFPMDKKYLLAAVRYVELNPVRAKIVKEARAYRWSSTKAYLSRLDDDLVQVKPMRDRVEDWAELLASGECEEYDAMRMHERTGRSLGVEGFDDKISYLVGRDVSKKKPGPKRRES